MVIDYATSYRHGYAPYTSDELQAMATSEQKLLSSSHPPRQVVDLGTQPGLVSVVDLGWDKQIFGIACSRLDWYVPAAADISNDGLLAALQRVSLPEAEHVRTRFDMRLTPSAWALEQLGFRWMGSNVILSLASSAITNQPSEPIEATEQDSDPVAAIASEALQTNQYAADPQLQAHYKTMHAEWARNSIRGRADIVIVDRQGDQVSGFITCLVDTDATGRKTGIIELLAVGSSFRGQGVGSRLVAQALAWFKPRVDFVEVGTQANNYSALAVYQKAGFKMVSHNLIFHRLAKGV